MHFILTQMESVGERSYNFMTISKTGRTFELETESGKKRNTSSQEDHSSPQAYAACCHVCGPPNY